MIWRSALPSLLPWLRRWLVGSVLLYVAVVALCGGRRFAPQLLQTLLTVWALFLLALWWRGRPQFPWKPTFSLIEVIVSNVALTLLLAELALRLVVAHSSGALLVSATLDAHRLRPGQDYGAGLRGNRLGYPGADFELAKPAGTFRLAALGDSFAVGPVVPFANNYLTRLEYQLPNSQVYNFGVSGAGPREYRAILQRDIWPHQPDAILLSLFVGNDITEELPTPRRLDPRQHALVLLLERVPRLWQMPHDLPARGSPPDRLQPALSPATFRAIEARRLAVCLQPPTPAVEKQWQRALAHLDAIIREARQHQVPIVVTLIPDEFQVNPLVRSQAIADAQVEPERVEVQLPQRRLQAFFAARAVPCLDLLPHFTRVPNTYALHDTHWNIAGNHLAAAVLSDWLLHLPDLSFRTGETAKR